MLIRRALAADVEAVRRLEQRWLEEGGVYGFAPEGPERLAAALGPYFLVAEAAGEVVGYVTASARASEGTAVIPAGESLLEIENVYVAPQFRGAGVGGRLIEAVLVQARLDGLAHASLYSAASDVRGVLRFYERHGFRSWYVRMFRRLS